MAHFIKKKEWHKNDFLSSFLLSFFHFSHLLSQKKKKTFFLLLSLVLVLSTESMAPPVGGQTVSYDELLLVFQWPTSYCNTRMNKCIQPIPLEFTVHGLWLNKNSKSVNCPTPNSRINLYGQVFSLSLLRLATKSMKNSSPLFWKTIVLFFWSDMKHQRSHTFQSLSSFFSFSPFPSDCVTKPFTHSNYQVRTVSFFLFLFCVWFVWVGEKLFDPVCMDLFGCFTLNHIMSEKHIHAGSNSMKQNNPLLFGSRESMRK